MNLMKLTGNLHKSKLIKCKKEERMPKKRNKLQQRRADIKRREKINRENYMENQRKYREYTNQIFNEGLQLMSMNRNFKQEPKDGEVSEQIEDEGS